MAVVTVGMHEAKTHFSRLVRRAQAGDDVIGENNGTPVARIVAYEPGQAPRRKGGFGRGIYWESADCWDPDPALERFFYEGGL